MKCKKCIERTEEESVSQYLANVAMTMKTTGQPVTILWNDLCLKAYYYEEEKEYD